MTKYLILGAKGFIGSNLKFYLNKHGYAVTAADEQTPRIKLRQTKFDVVFDCAGNSQTWLSEKDPLSCLNQTVIRLITELKNLKYDLWVELSSSAVYGNKLSKMDEYSKPNLKNSSNYAIHKLLAEYHVKKTAENWIILRPTGFFGPGLKKNLLFDLRRKKRTIYYTLDSFFDFMPIELFCEMVTKLSRNSNREIVNIGSGATVALKELINPSSNIIKISKEARFVDDRGFDLSKLKKHYSPMPTKKDIHDQIMAFIYGQVLDNE